MDVHREITQFLDYLNDETRSSYNTVLAYRNDLSQLREYFEESITSKDISSIDTQQLKDYIEYLHTQGYVQATISRKISVAKSLFAYLKENGVMEHNPAEQLITPRVEKSTPVVITPEEFSILINRINGQTATEIRDKAILELLYATGMRASEIISLDLNSIEIMDDRIWIQCGEEKNKRTFPINKIAAKALTDYLQEARQKFLPRNDSSTLFINQKGGRFTRQGVWHIVKRCAKKAGMPHITPQTLRNSFLTHMLERNVPERVVQKIVGHQNPSTTQRYRPPQLPQIEELLTYSDSHPRAKP